MRAHALKLAMAGPPVQHQRNVVQHFPVVGAWQKGRYFLDYLIPSMELRHLRYFVTVAEELHFTRAAKKLRIAQQALSAQIRNLEVELGFDLFVRGPKGVLLTAAGHELLNGAKETLATATASVEAARQVAERDTEVLRLGFCSYAMKLGLGDAINAFRNAWPDVKLALYDLPGADQLERLHRRELELAVCTQLFPDSPFFSGLDTVTLATEELVGIIPPVGASELPVPKCLQDYADLPFIGLDKSDFSEFWRFLDQICEKHHLRLRLTLQVKEKHSVLMLVAAGIGVSIAPRHIAETVQDALRIVPIPDLTEGLPIVAAFRPNSQNSMLATFLEVLKHCLDVRTSNLAPKKVRARITPIGQGLSTQ
jgi:DNA-binding transcriptional LysR family regulator